MSSDSMPYGPDTLIVPAYLVSDDSDPAYQRWRQDHPDAFVAGAWTSSPPARRRIAPTPADPRPIDSTTQQPTSALLSQSSFSMQAFLALSMMFRSNTSAPKVDFDPLDQLDRSRGGSVNTSNVRLASNSGDLPEDVTPDDRHAVEEGRETPGEARKGQTVCL